MVEDPLVSGFLRSVLSIPGYSVVPATPSRALELLRCSANDVDLLITNSPAMFAEFGDRIPLLYVAACPDEAQAAAFRTWRSLRKPFRPDQLLDAVAELAVLLPALH